MRPSRLEDLLVPVNRMLRYTGAAMRQLWSTRMAKGEMVMWVEMTLWRA